MGRIPSNHRLAERKLITLVQCGEWEIDEQGRIWRTCVRKGLKHGGSYLIPVKKRRVEKLLPSGYLMVRAMIDGKRIVGQASRLVWQHFFGDIPEGMIVNHKNMEALAERFGVCFQTISDIVRGKSRLKQGGPIQNKDLRHSVCERDPVTGRFVGKRAAGRLLDGIEHNGFPDVKGR